MLSGIFKKNFFPLTVFIYLIYSAVTIYTTSFVFRGTRYFILSDDAMISMRYGYNFAHGFGMVWNPGEYVEGFTNPLWTFFMALIHFLPVPLTKLSLIVQITEALCVIASLYFVKKIAAIVSNSSFTVMFFSVLFTAFYFPLVNWTLVQGMEVGILTLFLSSSVFFALESIRRKKFSFILFIILGLGTLTRIDFFVSAMVISLFLIIYDKKNRKKYFLFGIPVVLSFVLAQTLFRIWYYHDILPNTYYVKLTGYPILNRITRGIYVGLRSFFPNIAAMYQSRVLQFSARLIIAGMILFPFTYAYLKRNKSMFLLLALFTTQLLYSAYVGGDVWEYYGGANRFIAYAIPLFFVSLIFTTHSILIKYFKTSKTYLQKVYQIIEVAIICIFFILLNRANAEQLPRLFFTMPPTTLDVNMTRLELADRLNRITKPHTKIAISAAGLIPYFNPDRYFVDILGKTEKTIAREPAVGNEKFKNQLDKYISFQPGHMKWDYPYLVKKYKPDIFGDFYQRSDQKNDKYLLTHGYARMKTPDSFGFMFFILKTSPNINTSGLKAY